MKQNEEWSLNAVFKLSMNGHESIRPLNFVDRNKKLEHRMHRTDSVQRILVWQCNAVETEIAIKLFELQTVFHHIYIFFSHFVLFDFLLNIYIYRIRHRARLYHEFGKRLREKLNLSMVISIFLLFFFTVQIHLHFWSAPFH